MREALARSNLDMILAEETGRREPSPRSKTAKAAPVQPKRAFFKKAWRRRLPRKWLRIGAGSAFGALLVFIAVNAVMLQKGRHPAPIFVEAPRRAKIRPISRPAAAPVSRPAIQRAPVAPGPSRSGPSGVRNAGASADPLGALIRRETANLESAGRMDAVQKALRRLGFPLKITGRLDAGTKSALAGFQMEYGLPKTEGLNAHLLRVLAARSRMRIP